LCRHGRPRGSTRRCPSRVARWQRRLARLPSFRAAAGAWSTAQHSPRVSTRPGAAGPGPFVGSDAIAVSPDGKNLHAAARSATRSTSSHATGDGRADAGQERHRLSHQHTEEPLRDGEGVGRGRREVPRRGRHGAAGAVNPVGPAGWQAVPGSAICQQACAAESGRASYPRSARLAGCCSGCGVCCSGCRRRGLGASRQARGPE